MSATSSFTLIGVLIALFVGLFVLGGVVLLQIFLSKTQSRIPGLILPIISFIGSLLLVLSIAAFQTFTLGTSPVEFSQVEGSQVIDTYVYSTSTTTIPGAPLRIIIMFLLGNIPTGILLAIYFACRNGMKKRTLTVDKDTLSIDKMNIQDLE